MASEGQCRGDLGAYALQPLVQKGVLRLTVQETTAFKSTLVRLTEETPKRERLHCAPLARRRARLEATRKKLDGLRKTRRLQCVASQISRTKERNLSRNEYYHYCNTNANNDKNSTKHKHAPDYIGNVDVIWCVFWHQPKRVYERFARTPFSRLFGFLKRS